MKTLVFDIDGVVLRWNSRLLDFLRRKNIRIFYRVAKIIKENKFLDTNELDKYFKEGFLHSYHISPEAARFDLNYKRIPKILNHLSKEYNIIALTAFSLDKKAQENRISNLELHCPNIFSEIYFVDTLSSKASKLLELKEKYNIHLFVDDSSRNIKEANVIIGEDKTFHMTKAKQWELLYKNLL